MFATAVNVSPDIIRHQTVSVTTVAPLTRQKCMIRVQTCQRSLQGYLLLGIEELTLLTADKNWSHFNNHDDFPVLFNLPSSWSRGLCG
ncbi:hypothetical protein KP79_PYT16388 [Mizuhopecten yessoensis]|uniref:Uncharacterized protein n=1 Tax=Mizuhopecten yessoensis TaxID=6573 RepID=A0A210QU52_MIZYE|nr:hypothetical protein KP79_PYT16388 [Mizuhopecten yessoensis]